MAGRSDGEQIRKAASIHRVSSVTTVEAALAAVQGMAEARSATSLAAVSRSPAGSIGTAVMDRDARHDGTRRLGGAAEPGDDGVGDGRARREFQSFFDLADLGAHVVKSLAAFEWDGQPGAAGAIRRAPA